MIEFNIVNKSKISDVEKCLSNYQGSKKIIRELKIESINGKKMCLEIESTYPKIYGFNESNLDNPSFMVPSFQMTFESGNLINLSAKIIPENNDDGQCLDKSIKKNEVEFLVDLSDKEIMFYTKIKTQIPQAPHH